MNKGFTLRFVILVTVALTILGIAYFNPTLEKKSPEREGSLPGVAPSGTGRPSPADGHQDETKLPLSGDNR